MKIELNHLSKTEGRGSFKGSLLEGQITEAKMISNEGARLVEGMLLGRNFADAPVITARICGICPVVHVLTATKAMEAAMDIKVSAQTIKMRELLERAQIVHSHGLHLFFLSLPDFVNIDNSLRLIKQFPCEAQAAIKVREFGTKIVKAVGGRIVHPLRAEIGGFKVLPDKSELERIMEIYDETLKAAQTVVKVFQKLKFPEFSRKTDYFSLQNKKDYAVIDGDIASWSGKKIKPAEFLAHVEELHEMNEVVKRTRWNKKAFMVGALARLHNNYVKLSPEAKKAWKGFGIKLPTWNTTYNIAAQAVELIHSVEKCGEILEELIKMPFGPAKNHYHIRAGKGVGAVEAPRGTLYHYYEIDDRGRILNCNIITPTAQFLNNLEEDLRAYLPEAAGLPDAERDCRLKILIRAYDPCFSCATH
jgi:coenzyme F420-reducing hydrogenase alpha subunit